MRRRSAHYPKPLLSEYTDEYIRWPVGARGPQGTVGGGPGNQTAVLLGTGRPGDPRTTSEYLDKYHRHPDGSAPKPFVPSNGAAAGPPYPASLASEAREAYRGRQPPVQEGGAAPSADADRMRRNARHHVHHHPFDGESEASRAQRQVVEAARRPTTTRGLRSAASAPVLPPAPVLAWTTAYRDSTRKAGTSAATATHRPVSSVRPVLSPFLGRSEYTDTVGAGRLPSEWPPKPHDACCTAGKSVNTAPF